MRRKKIEKSVQEGTVLYIALEPIASSLEIQYHKEPDSEIIPLNSAKTTQFGNRLIQASYPNLLPSDWIVSGI